MIFDERITFSGNGRIRASAYPELRLINISSRESRSQVLDIFALAAHSKLAVDG